jgi:hypothetical protein
MGPVLVAIGVAGYVITVIMSRVAYGMRNPGAARAGLPAVPVERSGVALRSVRPFLRRASRPVRGGRT